jgi:hypothetical protein
VRNLIATASRRPRALVFGLAALGLLIMLLVRQAMVAAGASSTEEILGVFAAVVLYSIWVNVVLAKKIGARARRFEVAGDQTTQPAAQRTKPTILARLLFQASLFCLASWLLIAGSPSLGDMGKLPFSERLLIVACGLCVLLWRVFRARGILRRLNRANQSSPQ